MDVETIKRQIEENNYDFGEAKEMDEKYDQITKDILNEWESVEDYIGSKVFGFSTNLTSNGLIECNCKTKETARHSLIRNYYPSNLAKNTKHYVLWSLDVLSHEDISKILTKDVINVKRFYCYSPTENNRIVKDIWYIHVFVETF